MNALIAVALACAATVAPQDCTRDTALDVLTQPVGLVTECAQVGQLLATHLSLPQGGTVRIGCERRKDR
ncbi:MAG: hypothetical protein WAP03_21970 [Methylorubrum rhodinum]|uniref:hypothetical protein n=1 Tax=Methylorubrum rhodinum TaxID=29428 RepID=UPI003BB02CE1